MRIGHIKPIKVIDGFIQLVKGSQSQRRLVVEEVTGVTVRHLTGRSTEPTGLSDQTTLQNDGINRTTPEQKALTSERRREEKEIAPKF